MEYEYSYEVETSQLPNIFSLFGRVFWPNADFYDYDYTTQGGGGDNETVLEQGEDDNSTGKLKKKKITEKAEKNPT